MALIGKIRERSGLLVIIIGLALIAFILPEFAKSSGDPVGLGTVGGEKVDPAKYDNTVNAVVQQDQMQANQSQREYTAQDQKNSVDKGWSMLVENMVLSAEYEKLGIDVSDRELDAYLYGTDGFTVMPDLAQSFADSTGRFNPRLLEQRIQQMEDSKDPNEVANWENNKISLRENRKSEKYFQLLSQGVYVTKLEAAEEYTAQKEVKSISFVAKNYRDIPDEQIKVTDADVKSYYDEHKKEKKWEATAGRDVKYFDVTVKPSQRDSADFNNTIENLKNQFGKAKNDSLFVLANSDVKFFASTHVATFRPEGDPKARQGLTYPMYMDTVFKTAVKGQIVGPYSDQGRTRIAKVLDFNTNVLKVRHILLSAPKGDDAKIAAAQRKADSLMKTLTKDNFAEYVTLYSEDPGSKQTGGVYEDFMDYEMVPEFSGFAINKPVGTIGSVKTDFGIHIIEVMDKKTVKFPVLAFIEKTLVPSAETESTASDEAYNVLYKFDSKISAQKTIKAKLDMFDTLARKSDYFVRQPIQILDESPRVSGFATPFAEDKIIKLAYDKNTEVGTLCSAPIKDQGRYIIAIVSSIREKGVPNYEDVEARMRLEVIKEKKAKRFINQMLNEKSLEALAKKVNSTVMSGEVIFANPQLQGGGYEPSVVGSLFAGLKDGQVTVPLKGEQGVYVIRLNKTIKATVTGNYEAEKQQLTAAAKTSLQNGVKQALLKKADVKDNRKFNSLGIVRD